MDDKLPAKTAKSTSLKNLYAYSIIICAVLQCLETTLSPEDYTTEDESFSLAKPHH